jgi:hypothetical protein
MQQRGYQIVENIKKMQYKMALDWKINIEVVKKPNKIRFIQPFLRIF